MSLICPNNLYQCVAADKLCTSFGIKITTSPSIVQLAKQAGFHSLFIDLEHTTLSLDAASALCTTALLAGITPFVRVPHQCGNGFVQRVLDGGAMGVVVPHVHNREDAQAAVRICKYPPQGIRSMTGSLPHFNLAPQQPETIIRECNATGSTVMLMIETADSIDHIDEIAAVPGVEVLLVGSNDLSIELGLAHLGDPVRFESPVFRAALEKVSRAAKKYNRVFGLAGIYDRKDIHDWAVNQMGVRYILGQLDAGLLAKGGKACATALNKLQTEKGKL